MDLLWAPLSPQLMHVLCAVPQRVKGRKESELLRICKVQLRLGGKWGALVEHHVGMPSPATGSIMPTLSTSPLPKNILNLEQSETLAVISITMGWECMT